MTQFAPFTGLDVGACYHELFLRGKPELTHHIQRMPKKGQGPRRPSSWMKEPNFYAMPFLPSVAKVIAKATTYHCAEANGDSSMLLWNPLGRLLLGSTLISQATPAQSHDTTACRSPLLNQGSVVPTTFFARDLVLPTRSLPDAQEVLAVSLRKHEQPLHCTSSALVQALAMQSVAGQERQQRQVLRRRLAAERQMLNHDRSTVLAALFALRNNGSGPL